jgi:dsRNA-specific ribonuclease
MAAPPPSTLPPQLVVERPDLEALLGFRVNNPLLYQQAFVHKSAVRLCEERGLPVESYELYEFLGDAAINLVVTKHVFDQARARGEQEGWATKMRTRLVSASTT